MHYIYLIQNKINLKLYVGQTGNLIKRWSNYKACAKKLPRRPQLINLAMAKYGIENFTYTLLEQYDNQIDTDEAEDFYIGYFQTRNPEFGYNLKPGGNVASGWHHTEETKKKISEATTIQMQSEEMKKNLSKCITKRNLEKPIKAWHGKNFSEEHCQKLSESHKGKDNHQLGRTHSPETKDKMRLAKLGKKRGPMSEETKRKIGLANKQDNLI